MKHCALFSLWVILFSLLPFYSHSQKVDLDKKAFKIQYLQLPKSAEATACNSYDVVFTANKETRDYLTITHAQINQWAYLEGFVYTTKLPDLTFLVSIDKPTILSTEIVPKTTQVKNASGQMVDVTKFHTLVKATAYTIISLTENKSGKKLFDQVLATAQKPLLIESTPFDTRELADNSIKSQAYLPSLRSSYLAMMNASIDQLRTSFTFRPTSETDYLWEIDPEKAPEFEQFSKEVWAAADILNKFSYKDSVSTARAKMAPFLANWEAAAAKVATEEKKGRKIKFAYLLNIAVCQYWLEMYTEMEATAKKIIENDYDKKVGQSYLNVLPDLLKEMKDAGVNSRHLDRAGFFYEDKFQFPADPVVQPSPVQKSKSLVESVKGMGNEIKSIPGGVKRTVEKMTLGDTIAHGDCSYSKFKLNYNGQKIDNDVLATTCAYGDQNCDDRKEYVFFIRKTSLGLAASDGDFDSFTIRLNINGSIGNRYGADSLLALLKLYENDKLLTISMKDYGKPFKIGQTIKESKYIKPASYPKALSAYAELNTKLKSRDGQESHRTVVGDGFTIKVAEVKKIKLYPNQTHNENQAYMIKIKIPEIVLYKLDKYYEYFTGEKTIITDLEAYFLLDTCKLPK